MTNDTDRAVVDRIVEGTAVLLVGDDEREHHVPAEELPDGAGEGTWLAVRISLDIIGIDEAGEEAKRRHLEDRMARLRRRRGGGRFGGPR